MNILIVEDEMIVAMDMRATIEEQGHKVIGVGVDMPSALALAQQNPDLALVDLNLRDGKTGLLIAAKLTEAEIQVVLVTANPRSVLADGAKGIGLLSKPCDDECLLGTIAYYGSDASRHTLPDGLQVLN